MPDNELLKIFLNHPNEWLSGNQLADHLGVSRTMIWKHIKSLQTAGHQIESKHNRGYQYHGSNALSAINIQYQCHQTIDIKTFEQIDSTNQYVKQLVNQHPLTQPLAVVADRQTAGYGRRGRHFYSPAGTGLYLTIAVPVNEHGPINPGLLTTTTAVAIVKALKKNYPTVPFRLKWINDIWVHDQKVGGIMTESIMDIELMQPSVIIVGIGLNLTTTNFPADINQAVGAISTEPANRNQIAADIINQFMNHYPTYQTGNEMEQYRQLSVVIGKQVTIRTRNGDIVGTVETIADNGALVLRTNDGTLQHFMTGEVIKVRLNNR